VDPFCPHAKGANRARGALLKKAKLVFIGKLLRNKLDFVPRVYISLKHVCASVLQRGGGEAAQLGHPKVRQSSAHQKRQESYGVRAARRLPHLHRGERRGARGRLRSQRTRRRRHSR
jgi:hypothetical protein